MTTHANPSTSFGVACRHFFRHLHEPHELRRNPLASWYFRADEATPADDQRVAANIREAIRTYARSFLDRDIANRRREVGQRQYEILVRGDLEGVSREQLCAELGVSERQFHRDQRAVRRRVLEVFQRSGEKRAQRLLSPASTFDEALTQALLLDDFGLPNDALRRLDDVLSGTADAYYKYRALCSKSAIYCEMLRFDESISHLSEAERTQSRLNDKQQIECSVEIALLRNQLELSRGNYEEAHAHLDRAFAVLERRTAYDDRMRELHSAAFWQLAQRALLLDGATHSAVDALERSRTLAHTLIERRPSERIDSLLLSGALSTSRLDSIHRAFRSYEEALQIAQRHGLGKKFSEVAVHLGSLHLDCGNVAAARMFIEQASSKLSQGADTDLLGIAYAKTADLHLEVGAPERALDACELALRCTPELNKTWIATKAAQAQAWLRLGDPETALKVALLADEACARQKSRTLRAFTLRILALVHHEAGNKRQAVQCITCALELADGPGNLAQRALALEAASQIWGSTSHGREAETIRTALSHGSGP